MLIYYKTTKLKKLLTFEKEMRKKYGEKQTRKIKARMATFRAANALADLRPAGSPPERCHELTQDRAGQLSVDLDHPYRLLFEPFEKPDPELPDGGLDWDKVEGITILGIENTHE